MRLGLAIFLLLGVATATGSFLPGWQQYYKSPVFYFLLAVMSLNLGLCNIKRAKIITPALKRSPPTYSAKFPQMFGAAGGYVFLDGARGNNGPPAKKT